VLVVEWGDAVEALLPEQHLTVELTTGAVQEGVDGEPRTLVLTADGPVWEPRLAGLAAARGNERA
jgi:tRNA A37 threonylcarbamoyladenosine biosynthesis protein TsaE